MKQCQTELIITDIEGCVIPGARKDWQLEPLLKLREYNRLSEERAELPRMTLCSGRPAQYVEAVGQVIGVHLPMVCENGAVVYDARTGIHHPLYTDEDRETMVRVRSLMQDSFEKTGRAYVAEGKAVCVSLIPEKAHQLPQLLEEVKRVLSDEGLRTLVLSRSSVAVDITPPGIDKGKGVNRVLSELRIDWQNVLGIGDGGNDLPFLSRCGRTATPANGLDFVREAVDYVAEGCYGSGLVEILVSSTDWDGSQ
jgi:HAD superfamily hydrolase (TIGR01484 family)